MSHIDFDEIVRFALCERIDNEYLELAARINRHILQCPECLKMYKAINSFCESFEEAALDRSIDHRMVRVLESIYKNGTEQQMLDHLLSDFKNKIKDKSSVISINVKSNEEISFSDNAGGFNFFHPSDKLEGVTRVPECKNILVDAHSNEISLSTDGKLSFKLDKNMFKDGDVMYLVSNDDSEDVSLKIAKETEDGTLEVSYDGIKKGDYSVLL